MFLKIIGEFEYDHSERLGDSYEQLLSIMGSQGDAGQFRTPRHIIDFMVEVTDPQKSETILDPACGTAGFLIFSYNHILNKNRVDNNVNLSPEERVNLVQNIVGYDISPDMVRIALVNMYLHGFQNPKIYEYDTLASEDRWNDYFDIILANPPFMSPRGGVRPHKRFSIQSKRSEVLFVDYIAEHLTPHGRGAVIIPEGIIFQSGTAYKKLRKSLIESSLYAVVSLPAGVFNPYSGVKTSILFLNKNFAKKADSILFVKVSNDGFGLGAQRRKIKENDLPIALEIIQEYQQSINENKEMEFNSNEIKLAHLVKKEKIAESGDYNLSGDRYKETVTYSGKWDFVELGEICEIYQPKTITQKEMAENGKYLVFGANGVIGKYHSYNHEDEEVLITCRGATCGTVNLSKPRSWITGNAMVVTPKNNMLNKKYLFYLLKHSNLKPIISGAAQPQITRQSLFPYNVPLPPLEIQEQIVDELESYQKIIDGAKQVVENYKPTFKIDPDWEMVEIGNICKNIKKIIDPKKLTGQINYIGLENISKNSGELLGNIKSEASSIKSMKLEFKKKNILYAKLRPNLNKVYYTEIEGICSTDIMVLMFDEKKSIPKLYSSILREQWFNKKVLNGLKGAQLPRISWDYFKMIKVPVPPMEAQKKIILKIENEQKMIDSNKELIKIYEQKIKDKIAEVWGE